MMAEDLAAFFSPADFADTVTVNGVRTVDGIFDVDVSQTLGVDAQGSGFTCRVADALAAGDTFVRGGVTYRVAGRVAGDESVVTWQVHRVS